MNYYHVFADYDWRSSLAKDIKKRCAYILRADREKCLNLGQVNNTGYD